MILIIGGAWQGKLDLAKEEYDLSDSDIFTCDGIEIDFTRRCIHRLEAFTLSCVRNGTDPVDYFARHEEGWQDAVLICRDISSGVVPVDPVLRLWRNETGRLCKYLTSHADSVIRVFCGLGQRIK